VGLLLIIKKALTYINIKAFLFIAAETLLKLFQAIAISFFVYQLSAKDSVLVFFWGGIN